jgi:hypothetical protein
VDGPGFEVWHDLAARFMSEKSAAVLREILYSRTMLAVGISLDELCMWLEGARLGQPGRTHYVVATSHECDLKRNAEHLYRKYRVRVLLGDAADVPAFLLKLSGRAPRSS